MFSNPEANCLVPAKEDNKDRSEVVRLWSLQTLGFPWTTYAFYGVLNVNTSAIRMICPRRLPR